MASNEVASFQLDRKNFILRNFCFSESLFINSLSNLSSLLNIFCISIHLDPHANRQFHAYIRPECENI